MATCFSKGGWKNCLEQVCQQHGALSNMTPSQGRWHPSPLPDSVVRNSQGGGWGGATVTTGGWGPPWWSQIRGGHTSYLCQLHSPLVLHNLGTLEYWAAFIDVCTFDHCGFFFFLLFIIVWFYSQTSCFDTQKLDILVIWQNLNSQIISRGIKQGFILLSPQFCLLY